MFTLSRCLTALALMVAYSAQLTFARETPTRASQDLGSPFDADDLLPGERWFTRDHGGGTQALGHDFTIRRHTGSNEWTCTKAGKSGTNNSDYPAWYKPVYAVEDGVVERCWKNAPDNSSPPAKDSRIGSGEGKIPGGGNHILVRRPDGNLMLYAHFAKGQVSSQFCPQTPELMQAGEDKGYVFPVDERPVIKRGDYIGRVGNSGSSTGPHLHLHAVSETNNAIALPMERGLITPFTKSGSGDCNGSADINDWAKLNGDPIPQSRVLYWPPIRRLGSEYTRHKMAENTMQRMFMHLADSGYMLEWINAYSVSGKVYFNHVWKPADGRQWRALFGVTQGQLTSRVNEQKDAGYEPVHLDSYTRGDNGQVRYALIFHKNAPGWWRLRTNRSAADHQDIFDQAITDGLRPRSISVVSVNGERRWSALYRSTSIGSWQARSTIPQSDYQGVFDSNKSAGRFPIYLDTYKHGSQVYVSAIFASNPSTLLRARHGMSPNGFQSEWESNTDDGYSTTIVTGVDGASALHRYYGVWRKE